MEETRKIIPRHPSSSITTIIPKFSSSSSYGSESGELRMFNTPRDIAWKRRRRQAMIKQENSKKKSGDLTDEDLNELKGSIELGFGFKEEGGQKLCNTLPALDLYFAVNRQVFSSPPSPVSTPGSQGSSVDSSSSSSLSCLGDRLKTFETPGSEPSNNNAWKICSPGDDPQQVKTKLRHWAQAVACSVLQTHQSMDEIDVHGLERQKSATIVKA